MMDKSKKSEKDTSVAKRLLEKRKEILSLPPERALTALLDSPEALPIVHSFAEEDLFLLIHDIGPDDAVPILSLASNKQWDYILDMEVWEKDRFTIPSVLRWFGLLLDADADRLIQWLSNDQLDLFEISLFRCITVIAREHDEDPSAFGPGYFTLDDVYYIKFIEEPLLDALDKERADAHREKLEKILRWLATNDYERYQRILVEFAAIIPAEAEEEVYRLRNVRLAEKGFLPFEEAVGIYQPLGAGEVERIRRRRRTNNMERRLPVSLYPVDMMKGDDLFARVIANLEDMEILSRVQTEFAALCNQIIAADRITVREKDELNLVVRKACGYLGIGLQRLTGELGSPPEKEALKWVENHSLADIFRTGYDLAVRLKGRAERWQRTSWFGTTGLTLSFWGEKWLGVIGGLLLKRPLFFDNYTRGSLYREFDAIADVHATQAELNAIISMDRLLSQLDLSIPDVPDYFLTFQNVLLTLWSRGFLSLPEVVAPIDLETFKPFFTALFSGAQEAIDPKRADRDLTLQTIPDQMKENFIDWLTQFAGRDKQEILLELAPTLEALFQEIQSEYGAVDLESLDPKHMHMFIVK